MKGNERTMEYWHLGLSQCKNDAVLPSVKMALFRRLRLWNLVTVCL